MKLAKPCFDIGITVRNVDLVASFWRDRVGAEFDHVLSISPHHVQHRYNLRGSVLKLNARGTPGGVAPSGYHELLVAYEGTQAPKTLVDPEGNRVTLVPPGQRGIGQIALKLRVRNVRRHREFLTGALGLADLGDNRFQAGEGIIMLEQDSAASGDSDIEGLGVRYITFQIFDVRAEHPRVIAAGGRSGMEIQQLGDVARFVMVRDPDGNWIELSQRASLTGALGD